MSLIRRQQILLEYIAQLAADGRVRPDMKPEQAITEIIKAVGVDAGDLVARALVRGAAGKLEGWLDRLRAGR
jgi:hypothetical protein